LAAAWLEEDLVDVDVDVPQGPIHPRTIAGAG